MSDRAPAAVPPAGGPKARVYYPLALAFFPTLSLAAGNRGENIRLGDLVFPLLICFWTALTAWAVARALTRDRDRRALITVALVAWFLGYGVIATAMLELPPGFPLGREEFLLPLSLLLLLLTCWLIFKWKGDLGGVSRFLNRVTLLLFLFLPARYLGASRAPSITWKPTIPSTDVHSAEPDSLPDIYYVVLDAYTGSKSLLTNYGFDNSSFESWLRSRGFYVPRESRSNYASTFLALAAALNWQYLDWIPNTLGKSSRDRTLPYRMIEDSRTVRLLKTLGYRIVFFPTAYGATSRIMYADELIPSGARGQPKVRSEFLAVWIRLTILPSLVDVGCRISKCNLDAMPFQPESPDLILWKFTRLGEVATSRRGPKFVFAHLLVPHEPYVFEANCAPKPIHWSARVDPAGDPDMHRAYVEQVRCVNLQLETFIRHVLEKSARPPIIILQADHGNGRFPFGRPPDLGDISLDQLTERTDIFAAYYLPGAHVVLYDSITPINVLPIILRTYFGAAIPPLEDHTYYSSWGQPYRFTQIR